MIGEDRVEDMAGTADYYQSPPSSTEGTLMSTTTRAALVSLALVAFALAAPAAALAASLHSAPLNPALRDDLADGAAYLHSPVLVQRGAGPLLRDGVLLPASYDLRDVNGVSHLTAVRDQGSTGTCWAFATVGALESALMPATPAPDFSEDNMVNRNGYLVGDRYQSGGSLEMGEAYLARWAGPVAELVDPFRSAVNHRGAGDRARAGLRAARPATERHGQRGHQGGRAAVRRRGHADVLPRVGHGR